MIYAPIMEPERPMIQEGASSNACKRPLGRRRRPCNCNACIRGEIPRLYALDKPHGATDIRMEQAQRRGLARLMLRWPDRRAILREKCGHDPRLIELCEAYEAACEAAAYWSKSPLAVGRERTAEYNALASATEQDILERIS